MVVIALLAGIILVALSVLTVALLVGKRVRITEADRERAKKQPILMLVHRDQRWRLPVLPEDFFARILPDLISSSRRDARAILSQRVSPAAYAYFGLLFALLTGLEAACLLCRWDPMARRLADWEHSLTDALSGLLVSMSRCQRAVH